MSQVDMDFEGEVVSYEDLKHVLTLWHLLMRMEDPESQGLQAEVLRFGYQCETCKKVFDFDTVAEHMKIHKGKYKITTLDNPSRR